MNQGLIVMGNVGEIALFFFCRSTMDAFKNIEIALFSFIWQKCPSIAKSAPLPSLQCSVITLLITATKRHRTTKMH